MEKIAAKNIGVRINVLLADKEKGMRQKELASKLGVTDNTISYFVKGARTPNLEQIIKISEVFGVSTDYILGLTNVPTPNIELRAICDKTGLSSETVAALMIHKTIRDYTVAEFFDYLASIPELTEIIRAIDSKNQFDKSTQTGIVDIGGNCIEMNMSSIFQTYLQQTFFDVLKDFSLKEDVEQDVKK